MKPLKQRYQEWIEDYGKEKAHPRIGWAQTIQDLPSNAQITMILNWDDQSIHSMEKILKEWLYLADTKVCKIRSNKIKTRQDAMRKRITGMFVVEKKDTNAHFHGVIKLPDYLVPTFGSKLLTTIQLALQWEKVAPAGNIKIKFTTDNIGASIYQTKEFLQGDFTDQILFADKYWPSEYGL